jgi:hypothetical protein
MDVMNMLNEEIRVWFRDRTKKILTEEYFNTAWTGCSGKCG